MICDEIFKGTPITYFDYQRYYYDGGNVQRASRLIAEGSKNKIMLPGFCDVDISLEMAHALSGACLASSPTELHVGNRVICLTARELECVPLKVLGYTAKEIGFDLGISYRTVQAHLAHAREKLMGVDRQQLRSALLRNAYSQSWLARKGLAPLSCCF